MSKPMLSGDNDAMRSAIETSSSRDWPPFGAVATQILKSFRKRLSCGDPYLRRVYGLGCRFSGDATALQEGGKKEKEKPYAQAQGSGFHPGFEIIQCK